MSLIGSTAEFKFMQEDVQGVILDKYIARQSGFETLEDYYIVYTEHDGPDFQLSNRVLPSWQTGEDPLND